MATLATPHVAHNSISELYRATGATPEAQATLGLMWHATWGVFDAPLYVGFFVGMIGFTLIGVATFGSPDFSKGLGWMSVVLGAAGLVAAVAQMIDPASIVGMVSFFAYIIFYFALGWKVHSLSRT